LKCTSYLLIILGLIGLGSSLFHNFTAKHGAKIMIEKVEKAHMRKNHKWSNENFEQ
jgi:hypothetical protein